MADTFGQRLATLDHDTGERPTSRLGHAGNARQLVQRLKYEDQTRMHRYTRIMGLLDGNPPWPAKRLQDVGQGHRANFNLREGEGIVEAAKTPYYDLVFETPLFARIYFNSEGIDPTTCSTWNNVISEEYSETLGGWIGFDQNIQLHQWQMIVHGVGPIFWPHGISWRSEATKSRKVLVPQETKANVEDLEIVAVLHSYRADELESYIAGADPLTEDFHGWNVPLCKDAIIDCAVREMRAQYGIENYDLYQRAIRTGDLFYGINRSNRIYVASLFIREFGGSVSHYMVTDSPSGIRTQDYNGNEEEIGYLYKKRKKYKDFTQVICPFFFDTGPDGTWHAVKGLGPKIYDFCDVSNRTFCQMLDGAVIGSGITLEAQEGASLEETQIALVGGATVVQPGYKVVQTRIAESLNGAMSMRRELQNVLQSNTGSYRQRVAEESQEPTLGQAQINQQIQATLSKGATNRYCNNFNKFHNETLRRMMEPSQDKSVPGGAQAVEFLTRCVMRGIPPDLLRFRNIQKIVTVRAIGYGSPQMRDMATRELVNLVPMMDEIGRNHALRARATALPGIGQDNVDEFFPPIEKAGVPNAHTAQAVTENNALRTLGGQAIVTPEQNHAIHFDTHFQDAQQHLQDQNADPSQQLIHLEQTGGHLARHLKMISGDPSRKQEVGQKQKQLDALAKTTDQLHQQVQDAAKAAQDQQDQTAPDPAEQAQAAKLTGDLTLKAQKMKGEMALKAQKQNFQQTLLDKKTAADIRRKNVVAGMDMTQKTARHRQDLSHKSAKTTQDMNISMMQAAAEPETPPE
jgi:hypothetical protein